MVANSFAGEIHRFFPYPPLPTFNEVKEEVIRIVIKKIGGGTVVNQEKKKEEAIGFNLSSNKGNE